MIPAPFTLADFGTTVAIGFGLTVGCYIAQVCLAAAATLLEKIGDAIGA